MLIKILTLQLKHDTQVANTCAAKIRPAAYKEILPETDCKFRLTCKC